MDSFNPTSLDTLCAALCYAMGVDAPRQAAPANKTLTDYVDTALQGKKADRILMFNPDAIGQWIYEKYPQLLKEVNLHTELAVPFATVMPSVTPVCFGTMYTGAQPQVHGIQSYTKPVIAIDTIFDAMVRAGKKCAIVAAPAASLARIFLERDIDYIAPPSGDSVLAEATRLILEDKHDLIVVYCGNYDHSSHYNGPEDIATLGELRANSRAFDQLTYAVRTYWKQHNTLMGFAMDHGCHSCDKYGTDGTHYLGTHGEYIPEDINILHRYKIWPATE